MGYQGEALDNDIIKRWSPPLHARRLPVPVQGDRVSVRVQENFTRWGDLWVPEQAVRDAGVVRLGARAHPRGIAYGLDALTRNRLVHREHPEWTASAWSAAAAWGMRYFCDDADSCVLSGGDRRLAPRAGQVTRHRRAGAVARIAPVAGVDPLLPALRVTPPVLTVVQCLRSIRSGEFAWYVLPGTGLDDRTVRAVQFLDAACDLFGIDPAQLPDACTGLYRRRDLCRLVALADRGAESPMETVLRLRLRAVLGDEVASQFIPQLVIRRDGSVADPVHTGEQIGGGVVARVDLGCAAWKLAVQYDGAEHLARERRDTDSRVSTDLANLGWHVLRLTYGHLKDPELLRRTLLDGIRLAQQRLENTPPD